jgi:hypothetical protein
MIDAMKLAATLSKSTPEKVIFHLKEYQEDMVARGVKAVRESRMVNYSTQNAESLVIWGHEVREVSWY